MKSRQTILYKRKFDWLLFGTLIILVWGYILFHDLFGGTLFSYNDWDSYTLQALAWREGNAFLPQNYSWLELAEYEGNYYVSFPPVPSLIMFPLTFIFGSDVPSNFVIMVYSLLSVVFAYKCFCKIGVRDIFAMFWAIFFILGSNMFWMSTSGGSWFLAQGLNLTLCFGSILCFLYHKKTLSLILLAFAVGCRPFSICLFLIMFLYFCIQEYREASSPKIGFIVLHKMKYLIIPAFIALSYCSYNYIRFNDPFEFGHNYLPEFTGAGNEQFGLQYLQENAYNIFLRPVTLLGDASLDIPQFNGFMFFVANPIFIIWFVMVIRDVSSKKMTLEKILLIIGFSASLLLLLSHKTFGGWQFGARYTVDLLPFVLLYFLFSNKGKPAKWEFFLGSFALLFNLYGAVFMHLQIP
ncbi:hypothetical protein [Christensenella tenuis]|jgi:hypothetical protein|uniref:Glycosyltransferase RgtA/B/C/D-like domain-containing protein n=1 Tax=Christensenella tenuis TaxID=2763033 RepID=A0ABR7EB82_9FIRM|nr:hypothetical protein [Christensenella tenuis]MBC5647011.1 hypothetical protein [Christensenella tenuis]